MAIIISQRKTRTAFIKRVVMRLRPWTLSPGINIGNMSDKPKGWKAERFTFGTGEIVDAELLEDVQDEPTPYKQEKFDAGCYRTVIDFDWLDQQ